jgi:type I restriction enzyme, S subunit
MSFPRYSEYKDSGVEWLGEVPGHWEVTRLKNIASINMGQSPSSEDCTQEEIGLPFLQGNADFGEICPLPRSYCAVANKLANVNDILFSVRAPVGAINIADQSYGIGRGLCAITARPKHSLRFVFHALQVMKSELFSVATGSTYEAVSTDQVGNATCLAPPLPEQTQIAAFLDRETAKIDALVAEQRRLMELLKEKRQTVISHAVTRGLNLDAPMKPSGIEWLGDVPEHWEVLPAKRVSSVFVPQRNKPDLNADGDGHFWVTMEQMRSEEINTAELSVTESAAKEAGTRVLPAGSVVASCVGTFGLAAISRVDVIINQQLQAFMPTNRVDAKFMRHCVVIAEGYFAQIGTAATIAYVNQLGFANMPMVLPPKAEQHQIVTFLATESAKFDTLTTEAQRAINLLQERRTALISAAVTGQIDVRGAV